MTVNTFEGILTVKQFCERYPFISESGLRWKLFSDNCFRKECARKLGRRVYLLPEAVISFIKNGQGLKGNNG